MYNSKCDSQGDDKRKNIMRGQQTNPWILTDTVTSLYQGEGRMMGGEYGRDSEKQTRSDTMTVVEGL